ncbi:SDR family oxidoreductase [Streptomyces sp. NBC_01239]|uniref:SDR family NAD(P)-dependent oxidoreductase n=1 Tax=Streptomyces sp. NBC_01239 TaxID=2903792 RepID=UPI002258DB11|nr:SDR family oxidoreductase [Streptomyces sp. NBC_01239]MCX4815212.1 SDR family oxidoreductase [Streptomyces sp. NBC_01239]
MGFTEQTPDYRGLVDLSGRHVLVLGGGLGIGRQTCLAAASVGARVSVVDTDPARAEAVAKEVDGLALTGDATSRADVERLVAEAVARFGPIHGLADIIGISDFGPISEITDELWQRGLDLNLRHVLLALQIGARAMTEGGSMVFVGSISGLRSSPNHAVYGAAKAGVGNLVATACLELGPEIRVNVVAPGQTATPRVAERHPDPGYYDKAGEQVPLGRVGATSDIASAILFFLTDLSSWITGQTLVVDGGTGRRFAYSKL